MKRLTKRQLERERFCKSNADPFVCDPSEELDPDVLGARSGQWNGC
jgi:hypothetical protein